ncbi:hypothetical protein H0E86_21115 [Streptomyces sp. SCSIO-PteL053]|nr:hypothetical protein H0E86_21115 [Streptomyces sp. SCSIO-PteL053]
MSTQETTAEKTRAFRWAPVTEASASTRRYPARCVATRSTTATARRRAPKATAAMAEADPPRSMTQAIDSWVRAPPQAYAPKGSRQPITRTSRPTAQETSRRWRAAMNQMRAVAAIAATSASHGNGRSR